MNATALNRISIVLAFAGLFVAGVLGLSYLLDFQVPCGMSGGCVKVAEHPTSQFLGQPVAYYGALGYAILAALGVARALMGVGNAKPLVGVGFVISAIGTLISLYLTYVALAIIQGTCPWCLASAGIMTLLLLVHALMTQFPALEAEESTPRRKTFDLALITVSFLLALGGIGIMADDLVKHGRSQVIKPEVATAVQEAGGLIPPGAHSIGNADAKVTIVEFADLLCGACRASFPEAKRMVEENRGRIRVVFRHFPLYHNPEHRLALPAAMLSEYAGEKGRFWEFIGAVYAAEPESLHEMEGFYSILRGLNIDPEPAKRRMADKDDPIFNRVYSDMAAAGALRIEQTPGFVVIAEGQPTRIVGSWGLSRLLEEPQIKRLYSSG